MYLWELRTPAAGGPRRKTSEATLSECLCPGSRDRYCSVLYVNFSRFKIVCVDLKFGFHKTCLRGGKGVWACPAAKAAMA